MVRPRDGGRYAPAVRAAVAGLVVWAAASCSTSGPRAVPATTTTAPAATTVVGTAPKAGYPTPTPAPSTSPLRPPAAIFTPGTPYGFLATQDGTDTPVAYDPCRPIPVAVNGRAEPGGAVDLLSEALERWSKAAGFEFRIEGATEESPSPGRRPFQPEVYGDRWAPVLVAWSDPEESPQLAGEVAGSGGSTPLQVSAGGVTVYVTGMVVLDGPQLGAMLAREGGREEALAVVLHELGHLLGLAHVDDPTQLMHGDGQEATPGVTGLAAGDQSGAAKLRAAASCVANL